MQTLIIDGYNVIHAIPEIEELLDESLEAARIGLIRFLTEFKEARKDIRKIFIVFDGKSQGIHEEAAVAPGITAIYTKDGQEADEKIVEIIKDAQNPELITVVSDDNFLYNNTRALGSRIKTVNDMRRMLKQ